MNNTYQKPCAKWSEQLAASPKDLTAEERALLEQHITVCSACAAARAAYQQMDSDLTSLPFIEPRSIGAEQLPEWEGILSADLVAGIVQSKPERRVEQRGKASTARTRSAHSRADSEEGFPVSRLVRFQHALATLAAVLVVCVLIGSSVFLFSHRGNTEVGANSGPLPLYAALSNGTVYRLQPGNGAIVWKQQLNLNGQGVEGGPMVADGIVYIGSFNGTLYALNASNGSLLWQHSLGATPAQPTVEDGQPVVYVGAKATLYALRTSDGSEIWHSTFGTATNQDYVTPLTVAAGQVYGNDNSGLFAVDSQNGQVLWKGKPFNGAAFVIADGKVFETVGSGEQIEVLRASDGQDLHTLSVAGNLGYDQGKLYVENQENSTLYIVQPDSEHIIGQSFAACPVNVTPAPLTVQNGLVFTYSAPNAPEGWVCAMNANNGKQVWRWINASRAAEVASMLIANHDCYFLYTDSDFTQVQLYALNTANGSKLWQFNFPSGFPYGGYFAIEGK